MGLVKTRCLAAMQKQQKAKLRQMPKNSGWKPQPRSLSDCKPVWNGKN